MDYELMMNGNVKIGQKAPSFEGISTYGKIKLENYKGKTIVLFSYPGDFDKMSAKEIIELCNMYLYFRMMNTEIIGLSIDSLGAHKAWMPDIPFPIIADRSGEIARKYGMIAPEINNTETARNVFIIDKMGIIRVIIVYPKQIKRNINEILRIVKNLQTI